MSSREPLWFCHECNAEMRPLMVPDPHCASCNGTFVEKIEDPTDDPRQFHASGPAFEGAGFGGADGDPMEALLTSLFAGLSRPAGSARPRSPRSPSLGTSPPRTSGVHFQFTSGGSNGSGTRSFTFGGPNTLGEPPNRSGGNVPTLSEYIRGANAERDAARGPAAADGQTITGQLMARYLASLLGRGGAGNPLLGLLSPGAEDGRMGDYVFTQEALDQIMSQLMEGGDSHRPVPATDEVMQKLHKDVLEEGSPLLEKDCAVCKEQFQLNTEDPDELIVVTLPCKHPFHDGCITPWLKSSGTCPVCRHQLVPQPEQHGPGAGGSGGSPNRSRSPASGPAAGIFSSLFGGGSGGSGGSTTQGARTSGGSGSHDEHHIPGEWEEPDLD